ncbi:MAG: preprotein translocase subunit SecY [Candidatus Nanohaloarchaeota archaeon QJJ-7]|nr:preprotein translocase subunit SecY [Candidatus Nanohaloarchaeota archaeon QJJ-7]
MSLLVTLSEYLPAVKRPSRDLSFREKLTWTGIVILLYYVMSEILIYGASSEQLAQFQQLQTILGSSIGTLITLGIGPIVSASIILQLLVGADILPWDTNTSEGKQKFQGTQKLLSYLFAIFEAFAFVGMGAISPEQAGLIPFFVVVFQVALGGSLIILMDEIISKWGFGSGVSLIILAGVSKTILIATLSPFTSSVPANLWFSPAAAGQAPAGVILQIVTANLQLTNLIGLVATVTIFLIAVYAQSMRVEIPLTFGNVRGFGQKWPLKFIYTNVIPVIFVGALLSNFQLFTSLLTKRGIELTIGGFHIVGKYTGAASPSADTLIYYFSAPNGLITNVINSITTFSLQVPPTQVIQMLLYTSFYMVGSAIFSVFWMQTSGQDPKSVAEQIANIGMKVPGHRKDTRVIEKILKRYIPPLSVLGGAFVGFLAAVANFTNAFGGGMGILLSVMIAYQLYEELAKKHMEEMHPAFRKFMQEGV